MALKLFAITVLLVASTAVGAPPPGTVLWTYAVGTPIVSSPAIGPDGTVFAGSMSSLICLTNNGSQASNKWTFPVAISSSSPVVGLDGVSYVASSDGYLYAINPDGSKRWSFFAQCDAGSPALAPDGTIYVQGYQALCAVSASGALKWASPAGESQQFSTPAIGPDGTIYVASWWSRQLYAFTTAGVQKWVADLANNPASACAVADRGVIYVTGDLLYALQPNGTNLWSFGTPLLSGPPTIGAGGIVFVAGEGTHTLNAVSPAGQPLWQALGAPSRTVSTGAAADASGTVYFCSSNSVWALNSQGQVTWKITAEAPVPGVDGAITSPAIALDGTLYAALGTTLYAIAGTNPPAATTWPMYQHDARHTGSAQQLTLQQPKKRSDANFQFELYPQQLGLSYTVESSTNLAGWTSLTSFVATTIPMDVVDLSASNSPAKFYRAFSPP